jgi:hypothetical protein
MSYCEDLFERSLLLVLPMGVKFFKNYRPDWLVNHKTGYNLEYDFYIPEYQIAFEIQVPHHYEDISQIERDNLKKNLSEKNGIFLFCLSIFQVGTSIIRHKIRALSFSNGFKVYYDSINQEINQYAYTIKSKFGRNMCHIPHFTNLMKDGKKKAKAYIGKLVRIQYKGVTAICEVLGESDSGVYINLKIGGRIRSIRPNKLLRIIQD